MRLLRTVIPPGREPPGGIENTVNYFTGFTQGWETYPKLTPKNVSEELLSDRTKALNMVRLKRGTTAQAIKLKEHANTSHLQLCPLHQLRRSYQSTSGS